MSRHRYRTGVIAQPTIVQVQQYDLQTIFCTQELIDKNRGKSSNFLLRHLFPS